MTPPPPFPDPVTPDPRVPLPSTPLSPVQSDSWSSLYLIPYLSRPRSLSGYRKVDGLSNVSWEGYGLYLELPLVLYLYLSQSLFPSF